MTNNKNKEKKRKKGEERKKTQGGMNVGSVSHVHVIDLRLVYVLIVYTHAVLVAIVQRKYLQVKLEK